MRLSLARLAALTGASMLLAGCSNPRVQANMAEAMIGFGNELSALKQDQLDLQNTVDSLKTVVAKQDTLVKRLATLAGVPLP